MKVILKSLTEIIDQGDFYLDHDGDYIDNDSMLCIVSTMFKMFDNGEVIDVAPANEDDEYFTEGNSKAGFNGWRIKRCWVSRIVEFDDD